MGPLIRITARNYIQITQETFKIQEVSTEIEKCDNSTKGEVYLATGDAPSSNQQVLPTSTMML